MKSVIGQTYQNLEIILVDDGLQDSGPQFCDEYAQARYAKNNTSHFHADYLGRYIPPGCAGMGIMIEDDDHFSAGDMGTSATQSTYFHILYEGDGDYYVEFSTISGPATEVKIPVSR